MSAFITHPGVGAGDGPRLKSRHHSCVQVSPRLMELNLAFRRGFTINQPDFKNTVSHRRGRVSVAATSSDQIT